MAQTYKNPRILAKIENWPSGSKRVTAFFEVETHPTRGQRIIRATDGKPKMLTYAPKARIVDGDDGRTYLAMLTAYGFIKIMRGDMKFQEETIFPNNPRYGMALELFAGEA